MTISIGSSQTKRFYGIINEILFCTKLCKIRANVYASAHDESGRCQHSPSRMRSSFIAASRALRVSNDKRGQLGFIHTKASVRPVSLSHFSPSVRRALSCPGAYGANLERAMLLRGARVSARTSGVL